MKLQSETDVFRCYKHIKIVDCYKSQYKHFQLKNIWFNKHNLTHTQKQMCRLIFHEIIISSPTCIDRCSYLREVSINEVCKASGVIGNVEKIVEKLITLKSVIENITKEDYLMEPGYSVE